MDAPLGRRLDGCRMVFELGLQLRHCIVISVNITLHDNTIGVGSDCDCSKFYYRYSFLHIESENRGWGLSLEQVAYSHLGCPNSAKNIPYPPKRNANPNPNPSPNHNPNTSTDRSTRKLGCASTRTRRQGRPDNVASNLTPHDVLAPV